MMKLSSTALSQFKDLCGKSDAAYLQGVREKVSSSLLNLLEDNDDDDDEGKDEEVEDDFGDWD